MSKTQEVQEQIFFEESPRDYRTEIPNIVYDLVRYGKMSHWAKTLYGVYRRIAGEHGKCFVGERGLAEHCGFSRTKVQEAKKELLLKRPELNGRALISVAHGNIKESEADRVTIIDIWAINFHKFKNKLTWPCGNPPLAVGQSTPGRGAIQKNEHLKKKPIKNIDKKIVHNFDGGNVHNLPDKQKDSIEGRGSIPVSQCPSGKMFDDPELLELLEMEPKYLPHFAAPVVTKWIQKFSSKNVLLAFKFYFDTISIQKQTIRNPEAWMEKALKDSYAQKNSQVEENKTFAENFKKEHNLRNLKINKRYCIDTEKDIDVYYHLPSETFKQILNRLL